MDEVMRTAPRGQCARGRTGGRAGRLALAAVALTLAGPATARDVARDVVVDRADVEPRAWLDRGRGPGLPTFRLNVEGGEPLGRALLVLRPEGGLSASRTLALDERGAGAVTLRDWACE